MPIELVLSGQYTFMNTTDKKVTLFHEMRHKEMHRVKRAVEDFRNKKIERVAMAHDHREPLSISAKSYLRVLLSQKDDSHYEGYSLEVHPRTHKIISGRYFQSFGTGTYRESELSHDELLAVVKYYDLANIADYFT